MEQIIGLTRKQVIDFGNVALNLHGNDFLDKYIVGAELKIMGQMGQIQSPQGRARLREQMSAIKYLRDEFLTKAQE
jgi:hypothetical protein